MKKILDWYNWIKFNWLRKVQLVDIDYVDVSKDPVRPNLDLKFRTSYGRKIYGLKYENEIVGVICVAYTNDIPTTEKELDLMSKVSYYEKNSNTAIAYTVWSHRKGAGKKIMEEAKKFLKGKADRIVTLSPLTPMATHYHIRNGAKLINLNPTTQNFEYKL